MEDIIMKKKVIATLMAVTMTATMLAACGDDSKTIPHLQKVRQLHLQPVEVLSQMRILSLLSPQI